MQLKPFSLDIWLDAHEHSTEFNLAASTGPAWTFEDLLALAGEEESHKLLKRKLAYGHPAGAETLRNAIAEMQGVGAETIQLVTGASEALLVLMWVAAEPGANVILPRPSFPTFSAIPKSLGLEIRYYTLRRENAFAVDIEEIKSLSDGKTKLVLLNSPHNPTGSTVSDDDLDQLHEFTASHAIQLVSNEVYHPIYHGRTTSSAARLPYATVISDFSKAFPFAGIRTGWILERDVNRRQQYWNARAYFSISNNTVGEVIAEVATRQRHIILGKSQDIATRNLKWLDLFMEHYRDALDWIRPQGGMTAFPWLVDGESTREFCELAARAGVLLAPGDCFDMPSHFRLGFAASATDFPHALERLGGIIEKHLRKPVLT